MTIQVEQHGSVIEIILNRPEVRNALNTDMTTKLIGTLEEFDQDPYVACFLIRGAGGFFSAGADIKELRSQTDTKMKMCDYFSVWEKFNAVRTPKIAAVTGFALGGGCELAMMCDTVYAAESARFGLPEITLGVIPGIGGTQRLTRTIGKAKAMDMILTGRQISALEAEKIGLVARIFPEVTLFEQSLNIAQQISRYSKLASISACESINRSLETTLNEGILFERRTYHALFGTRGQQEGMQHFIDKK